MTTFAEETHAAVAHVEPGPHPVSIDRRRHDLDRRIQRHLPDAPEAVLDDRALQVSLALVGDVREDGAAARAIRRAVDAIRRRLEDAPRHRPGGAALDFLDLLLKTRDLIRGNPEVRGSFQQRFKRVFVDEFQDTDPLQAEILLLLAAGDPAETDWRKIRPIPGKLFLVGDPKQSIYRFRRADVGIYRSVYQMLQEAGAKRVTLRTSFRARANIQRAINAAFEPVMSGDGDGLQAAYVPLEPFRGDPDAQPTVVALPVPEPYGYRRLSNAAVEKSLPDAVGAFVHWLVSESGWKVAERPAQRIARSCTHTSSQAPLPESLRVIELFQCQPSGACTRTR